MQKAFSLIFLLLLVWGGLGIALRGTVFLGLGVSSTALISAYLINKGSLKLPKGLGSYLIFLLTTFWLWLTRREIAGEYFLVLFLTGGAFWVAFFNLKKVLSERFANLILVLGIFFGLMFVWNLLLGDNPVGGWNLYLYSNVYQNHNHLGDLWALTEIIVLRKLIKTRAWYWWVLGLAGAYFLAISLSRSAYVAFFAGAAFLAYRENWLKKYPKLVISALILPVVLFLLVGLFKTTLYSRLYFVQGLLGFFKYPFGVGMGNFGRLSNEILFLDEEAKAALAHNIVLEVVSGVGVWAIIFIYWLANVLKDTFRRGHVLYSALFVGLSANFFFDTTYYIPSMIWLWYMLLGLAQEEK